jgi:hypothetical protein
LSNFAKFISLTIHSQKVHFTSKPSENHSINIEFNKQFFKIKLLKEKMTYIIIMELINELPNEIPGFGS